VYENRVPLIFRVSHRRTGLKALELPVTKIARYDAERVRPREERRNGFPELSFRLLIYRTNEDGNNGYVQPEGIQPWATSKKSGPSPFEYFAYIRQMHFDAVLIFVSPYIHIAKAPRGTQFVDGCVQHSLINHIAILHKRGNALPRSSGSSPMGVA
jgi:hypothetical protein